MLLYKKCRSQGERHPDGNREFELRSLRNEAAVIAVNEHVRNVTVTTQDEDELQDGETTEEYQGVQDENGVHEEEMFGGGRNEVKVVRIYENDRINEEIVNLLNRTVHND